jgi:AcrR family transcriptional regulator
MNRKFNNNPPGKRPYHHGDLRRALLDAGRELLEEKGADGFSLRACAMHAGVSHAAPAHHFKDMKALFTALATEAYSLFGKALADARDEGLTPKQQIVVSYRAYLGFARTHPALFKLMFDAVRLEWHDEVLKTASKKAYQQLILLAKPFEQSSGKPSPLIQLLVWSLSHGVAHLELAKQVGSKESPISDQWLEDYLELSAELLDRL